MLQYHVVVVYDGIDEQIKCESLERAVSTINRQIAQRNDWVEARIDVQEGEGVRTIFRVLPPVNGGAVFASLNNVEHELLEGTFARFSDTPINPKLFIGIIVLALVSIGAFGLAVASISLFLAGLAG